MGGLTAARGGVAAEVEDGLALELGVPAALALLGRGAEAGRGPQHDGDERRLLVLLAKLHHGLCPTPPALLGSPPERLAHGGGAEVEPPGVHRVNKGQNSVPPGRQTLEPEGARPAPLVRQHHLIDGLAPAGLRAERRALGEGGRVAEGWRVGSAWVDTRTLSTLGVPRDGCIF